MRFFYILSFCLAILITTSHALTIKQMVPSSTQLKWMDARELPKGAKVAIVTGDPKQHEFYVAYLKLPANYVVPLHYHLQNEADTVISGVYYFGAGNKINKNKFTKLMPGSFVFFPSYVKHFGWTKQETILEISGVGPWGTVLVKESV